MKPHRYLLPVLFVGAMLAPVRSFADHKPEMDKLGTINFMVNGRPEAQAHVVRGVKLVHHMNGIPRPTVNSRRHWRPTRPARSPTGEGP